jgi:uncharacterized protein YlxW (UPF0749 family)
MTDLLTKQDLQAAKPDLQSEIGTISTAIDEFEARLGAKIDAQTRRLTIRLGSILIAGLVGMGLVLFAGIPFLIP